MEISPFANSLNNESPRYASAKTYLSTEHLLKFRGKILNQECESIKELSSLFERNQEHFQIFFDSDKILAHAYTQDATHLPRKVRTIPRISRGVLGNICIKFPSEIAKIEKLDVSLFQIITNDVTATVESSKIAEFEVDFKTIDTTTFLWKKFFVMKNFQNEISQIQLTFTKEFPFYGFLSNPIIFVNRFANQTFKSSCTTHEYFSTENLLHFRGKILDQENHSIKELATLFDKNQKSLKIFFSSKKKYLARDYHENIYQSKKEIIRISKDINDSKICIIFPSEMSKNQKIGISLFQIIDEQKKIKIDNFEMDFKTFNSETFLWGQVFEIKKFHNRTSQIELVFTSIEQVPFYSFVSDTVIFVNKFEKSSFNGATDSNSTSNVKNGSDQTKIGRKRKFNEIKYQFSNISENIIKFQGFIPKLDSPFEMSKLFENYKNEIEIYFKRSNSNSALVRLPLTSTTQSHPYIGKSYSTLLHIRCPTSIAKIIQQTPIFLVQTYQKEGKFWDRQIAHFAPEVFQLEHIDSNKFAILTTSVLLNPAITLEVSQLHLDLVTPEIDKNEFSPFFRFSSTPLIFMNQLNGERKRPAILSSPSATDHPQQIPLQGNSEGDQDVSSIGQMDIEPLFTPLENDLDEQESLQIFSSTIGDLPQQIPLQGNSEEDQEILTHGEFDVNSLLMRLDHYFEEQGNHRIFPTENECPQEIPPQQNSEENKAIPTFQQTPPQTEVDPHLVRINDYLQEQGGPQTLDVMLKILDSEIPMDIIYLIKSSDPLSREILRKMIITKMYPSN